MWIDDVVVVPTGEITELDNISLWTYITLPSRPFWYYQPTDVFIVDTNIFVNIFLDRGNLDTVAELIVSNSLGILEANNYEYTVILTLTNIGPYPDPVTTNKGSFTVVPEISVLWFLLGFTALVCLYCRKIIFCRTI